MSRINDAGLRLLRLLDAICAMDPHESATCADAVEWATSRRYAEWDGGALVLTDAGEDYLDATRRRYNESAKRYYHESTTV